MSAPKKEGAGDGGFWLCVLVCVVGALCINASPDVDVQKATFAVTVFAGVLGVLSWLVQPSSEDV